MISIVLHAVAIAAVFWYGSTRPEWALGALYWADDAADWVKGKLGR